jgi:3-hydroxybutyryl-CoA dehydrogenase
MGSGIAEVCARGGLDVLVNETDADALQQGEQRINRSIARAVKAGKVTQDEAESALGRLSFSTTLRDVADRDIVLEAVAENEQVKVAVFAALDEIVGADAVLASNTSSIPIIRLAMATRRPEQVIGIHFFNPVPVMPLVEVIPSLVTSEQTVSKVTSFLSKSLGKTSVAAQDRAGFIVNSLLIPYLLSAIRMFESGFASAESIDQGMELGCAHPMGPLRLADFIGLDTVLSIAEVLYGEYKDPSYTAPPLLSRMVEARRFGRKSGQGFYSYAK